MPRPVKKHCKFVGLEGYTRICCFPGCYGMDVNCSGYENCKEYEEADSVWDKKMSKILLDTKSD